MSARKDLDELNKWLKEAGVDTRSLILLAKEIAISCVDEGIVSERINMKSEDGGVSALTERLPAVSVAALGFIHKVVEDEKKRLEKTPEDRTINFIISDGRLEDELL
jgi:hypothetical protein